MIKLTTDQTNLTAHLGRRPASSAMTVQQSKQEAQRLLARGLSEQAWSVVDLLTTGGVMQVSQLGLSDRTLRKYAQGRLIDRLPYITRQLSQALSNLGLPGEDTSLYTLGPVGIEIAKHRHGQPPLTGYLGYTLQHTLHDLLRNEIVLRFSAFARSLGWSVGWLNHQEATLQKDGEVLLEPDAMLRLKKDGKQKDFLLEYHDEDTTTYAWKKFRQYELASRTGVWASQWETDVFPVVLVVFRKAMSGQGYQNAIKECEQVHCTYYGKVLKGWLEGNLAEWRNVATEQREQVFGDGDIG